MSNFYNALVDAAKGMRQTNQRYIQMLNGYRMGKRETAKYKRYMKQNIKEARFYLAMAKAEKEYLKDVKTLRSGNSGTDHQQPV
jgi:uncharacterized protein YcgL (UPF0745 family)